LAQDLSDLSCLASRAMTFSPKVSLPFESQLSVSTCDEAFPFTEQISSASEDEPQAARLWARAMDSHWRLQRGDLKVKVELSRTLKSTLYQATWRGVDVVVKCAGLHDGQMANKVRCGSDADPDLDAENKDLTDELLHEIDLLSSLRHPDLVMFLGACLDQHLPILCVTEFLPRGDLEKYYASQRQKHDCAVWRPKMKQVLEWLSAMLRALCFLHGRDVAHRDLKPMNLLLTKHLDLKVSDFGISRLMESCENYRMTGGVGSYRYMAPEVVRYQAYDEKVDIYACGLIMYFMNSGKQPFHQLGRDPEVILKQYQEGKEPRPLLQDCSKELRPLMEAAWHIRPHQRPSAEELLERLDVGGQSCGPCAQM